jgi:DNA invertase Pin-like site-specific DNA recombinase
MTNPLIQNLHLSRQAIVYLRQSSFAQVTHNRESLDLQYQLTERAQALGWTNPFIIDEDLGISASGSAARPGFQKMLKAVAAGEVGVIFSREASRLSRNDRDWCQLLEICRICDTLIGDESALYDTACADDQLVLGIKATLSVAELNVMRTRLIQGQENKAARGELYKRIGPGYVCLDGKHLVKDPDQRVQDAITLVLSQFCEMSSVRQLMLWFHEQKIELPLGKVGAQKKTQVWQLPKYTYLKYLLQNPLYAGAYYYGRTGTEKVVDSTLGIKVRHIARKAEDSRIFIKDHHEPYITWQEYEKNQQMIQRNNQRIAKTNDTVSGIRGGQGLLTGLLRCGHCGRRLHIRYWGAQGTASRYLCKGDYDSGGEYCLGFGGGTVDKRFSQEILKLITPYTFEASLIALEKATHQDEQRRQVLDRKLQQKSYEATRAFEQYNEVDPRNRLVAEVLEKRWNDTLAEVDTIQKESDQIGESTRLSSAEKQAILDCAEDFETLWESPSVCQKTRKKIMRLLLKDIIVTLDKETQRLNFTLHWEGGSHTCFEMDKPHSGAKQRKTREEDLSIIQQMAPRYQDEDIARVLGKLGRRTGAGLRWNATRVKGIRSRYHIRKTNAVDNDILTLGQAEKYTGVSDTALLKLIKHEFIQADQIVPYAPLEIKRAQLDADPVKSIIEHLKSTGKLVLDGMPLDKQPTLFE